MQGPNHGNQRETRLDLSDTVQSAILKLSEGNPGAIRVCAELLTESRRVDQVGSLGGFAPLLNLDTLGIYGEDLWDLYKRPCRENAENLVAVLRANQLGLLSDDKIRQGHFDPETVKQMVVKELGPKDFVLASARQEPSPAQALPAAFAHRPHPMSLDAVLAHKMQGLSAGRPSTLPAAFSALTTAVPRPDWSVEVLRSVASIEPSRQDPDRPWLTTHYNMTGPDGSVQEVHFSEDILILKNGDRSIRVPAFASSHVMSLHLHGEEPGSVLAHPLEESFAMVAKALPAVLPYQDGKAAFSIELGQPTGMEGVTSQAEMLERGIATRHDLAQLALCRDEAATLNKSGTLAERQAFVDSFNATMTGNVKLGIRGDAIVPFFSCAKQSTTKMFLVVSGFKALTAEDQTASTLITMAPGRCMEKLPTDQFFAGSLDPARAKAQEVAQKCWWDGGFLVDPPAKAPTVYQAVTQDQLATMVHGFNDLTAKKDVPVRALTLDQAQIDKINAEGGFKTVVIDENGNTMVETVNKSMLPGDHLVTNQIEGQDNSYIVTAAKFAKLYTATDDPAVFNPVGDSRTVFELPVGVNLEFEAPWGGMMKIRSGGVLVPDNEKFYGINPEEFRATYRVVTPNS